MAQAGKHVQFGAGIMDRVRLHLRLCTIGQSLAVAMSRPVEGYRVMVSRKAFLQNSAEQLSFPTACKHLRSLAVPRALLEQWLKAFG